MSPHDRVDKHCRPCSPLWQYHGRPVPGWDCAICDGPMLFLHRRDHVWYGETQHLDGCSFAAFVVESTALPLSA